MPLVVQKFGGTSVADSQKILAAARKAVRAHQTGNQVVMVVSAMGKNTDTLIGLAQEVSGRPPAREMDMLLETSFVNSAARDAVNSTEALPCAQSGPKVRPAETVEETSDRNVELDEYPLDCSKPA